MASERSGHVQSLERALTILERLAEHPDGCSIKILSEETGLHKSTVHRLLRTLMDFGYVHQDKTSERYHLGIRLLYLSNSLAESLDIRTIASPHLKELSDATGEVVHLSIRDGRFAVYIDKVETSTRSIRMNSRVGKSIPLYCSATGKALLAWLPEGQVREILGDTLFQRITKNTITDLGRFLDHLSAVRMQGYATDWFENEDSIFCVAAPVFDSRGAPVASVSVSGTILQIDPERFLVYCTQANLAARLISQDLGCREYPAPFHPRPMEMELAQISPLSARMSENRG